MTSNIFSHTVDFIRQYALSRGLAYRSAVLIIFICLSGISHGHEVRPSIIDLNLQDQHYQIEINLNLEVIMAGIEPGLTDTDDSENASRYTALRALTPAKLTEEFNQFKAEFFEALDIQNFAGETIDHKLVFLKVDPVGDIELSRDTKIILEPIDSSDIAGVTWLWAEKFGTNIIRVNNLATQADSTEEEGYSAYLQGGERSEKIPLTGEIKLTTWQVIKNYLVIGFTHIVPKGLDHILFVVGLFLLSPALRPLLIQITSFTLAHTVTLALGVTGVVQLSPSIVEPLIAASIVYVCIENIFSSRMQKWRPVIVFAFGLLHGLGFAGVLSEVGIASAFFVTALLSFNVGVEIGQLAVIAGCFLLVGLWFRNKTWYRSIVTIPASVVIALIGLFWFVERTMG